MLQQRYGEVVTGIGVGKNGKSVLEIFTSLNGSWTALITRSNGVSCIIVGGENWEWVSPEYGDKT